MFGTLTISPGQIEAVSPAELVLNRQKTYEIKAQLKGHLVAYGYLERVASGAVHGNVTSGGLIGLIGMLVDSDSGADFRLVPNPLRITLNPIDRETESDTPDPVE